MLYDVTNQNEKKGTGFGAGDECDGPKGTMVVGKGVRVIVAFLHGGEWVVLGDRKGYPEGTYELMADLGTDIRYTPKALSGFVSNRVEAFVKVQEDMKFDQNFYATEASAQEPDPEGEDFAESFEAVDPFEADMRKALAEIRKAQVRIEAKLDRLLTA